MRGSMKVAAIKAPLYGEERRNLLHDLAISVGATFVTRESGIKLQEVQLEHLGTAKSVESSKYYTTIVGGCGDFDAIEEQITTLKSMIEQEESMQKCVQHQDRIVRLSSGVAVIRVGGSTEVEMTERKHRIEDALEAVKSAQEEGIIGGGGSSLLRAARSLDTDTEDLATMIIQRACEAPIRQMADNAGVSADIIIKDILQEEDGMGWNFRDNSMVDLFEAGIIDPAKVTRTALQNAVSCAGTLITTNYGIIQTG